MATNKNVWCVAGIVIRRPSWPGDEFRPWPPRYFTRDEKGRTVEIDDAAMATKLREA